MTERTWVVLLLVPAPLYVAGRFLFGFSLDSAWIPLGFAVTLSFGLASGLGVLRPRGLVWVGVVALLLAILLPLIPPFPARTEGLDLGAGVMLGLPFVALEGAWRSRYSPAVRLGTLELILLLGVWYLAALPGVAANGGLFSGYRFFEALSGVLGGQGQGLYATFTGGGSTAIIPLRSALDPAFVGLAALALLGVMITALAPRTALDEPLPWAWTAPRRPHEDLSGAIAPEGLRDGQREALRARSRPVAPDAGMPPGAVSLILAGFGLALAVAGAMYLPAYFLFALTVATAVLVAVLIVRLTRPGGPPVRVPSVAGGGEKPRGPEPPPARPA